MEDVDGGVGWPSSPDQSVHSLAICVKGKVRARLFLLLLWICIYMNLRIK